MSNIKFCDYCGKQTDKPVSIMGSADKIIQKDFCESCWKKVEKFLESLLVNKKTQKAVNKA